MNERDGDGITPWAFIAHKEGFWCGVASATLPKRDLRKFLGDFAANGFAIMTVNSRAEYLKVIDNLKPWAERKP